MVHDISYANRMEVIEDFLYDANRKIPVELICKASEVKEYLNVVLSHSKANLRYLHYDMNEFDGIKPNDEVSIEITADEIWVEQLINYHDGKRIPLFSGDGCLKYVDSKCDDFFFDDDEAIGVFKFTVEG